jgi:hypothetical protein
MTGKPIEQRPGLAQVAGEGFLAGQAVVAGVADAAFLAVGDLVQGDLGPGWSVVMMPEPGVGVEAVAGQRRYPSAAISSTAAAM